MIEIDDVLISDDIVNVHFCCDLPKCLGMCCIEGDAGAPLEKEEAGILGNEMEVIFPYMTKEGANVIREKGVFEYDDDGEMVTPLVKHQDCAFVYYDNTIAKCAIERAWLNKKIDFQKPISCHLYPIRISKLHSGKTAINYHQWHICNNALQKGKKEDVPLYLFLKEPLIRFFGEDWYARFLEKVEKIL